MASTDNRFLTADPALAVGTAHEGFTVTEVTAIPEIAATAYVLRHDASGARALWLACADTNRSFSIAFKTPPADDTGVFHILEHSVLCGSDAYPVKEPFVNLLKTSMQTFLNALTFPDKTMYPVASTNVADLENLMGVYLDAVLHPAIYRRPRIFEQEGWHYELDGLDAPLTYNGVVFNEMKGALSDPDEIAFLELNRLLFPDSPYGFESGGHPRAIPTLTYDAFLGAHARHYNLANSYTILYGDLDIDRELAFIGERFDGAANRGVGAPNPLPLQPAVAAGLRRVEMATAPENATVALSYVFATSAERERVLAADILLDALCGSNEAPLKRRVLDAGLADDFQASLIDGIMQPMVIFQLKGAREGVAEEFRTLVESTCAEFVRDGIDREKLEASLAQAEFDMREGDWGSYGDGVALSMQALSSWLYDDARPVDYLRYEDALAHAADGVEKGLFERLLDEMVVSCPHSAEVEVVPVEGGDAAEELAELAAHRAAMSEADLRAVMDEVAALREEQGRPDAPEALATLPSLGIDDIDAPVAEPRPTHPAAPLPCIAHDLDTRRIEYVYHYFDLRRLTAEELPYVGVLAALLTKLATTDHTASELDTLIERNLGGLSFFSETYAQDDDPTFARPTLVVAASSLSERVDALATIPTEVWARTRFDDTDAIRDILTQRRVAAEQAFVGMGHSAAVGRLNTYFSSAAVCAGILGGIDQYLFVRDLLDRWDEVAPGLPARLADLAARIFTADEMVTSLIGSAEDRGRFWAAGGTLGLATTPGGMPHVLEIPTPVVRNEGFVIPANVNFVAEGSGAVPADAANLGTWLVAGRVLSFDYLWNEVRVKGGAYGAHFTYGTTRQPRYWSFRDPNIDATVERQDAAGTWLRAWEPTDDELTGYVVSTVATHDAPTKPRAMARRQDREHHSGHDAGWRDRIRAQELATTAEMVRGCADALDDVAANRAVCVFGTREAIESSGLGLTVVDLFGARE